MEYKLAIGEKTDNKELVRPALQWLCVHANTYTETKMHYCTRLKSICEKEQWLKIREVLIKELVQTPDRQKLGFWLLRQEGLNERLYGYISGLPLHRIPLDMASGGYMLEYYVLFADAFSEEQQEALEKRICDSILNDAANSNKEKEYYGIKYGIKELSKVRPESHAKAVTLRDNLIRLYPRKPLFLSVLKDLNL